MERGAQSQPAARREDASPDLRREECPEAGKRRPARPPERSPERSERHREPWARSPEPREPRWGRRVGGRGQSKPRREPGPCAEARRKGRRAGPWARSPDRPRRASRTEAFPAQAARAGAASSDRRRALPELRETRQAPCAERLRRAPTGSAMRASAAHPERSPEGQAASADGFPREREPRLERAPPPARRPEAASRPRVLRTSGREERRGRRRPWAHRGARPGWQALGAERPARGAEAHPESSDAAGHGRPAPRPQVAEPPVRARVHPVAAFPNCPAASPSVSATRG